MITNIRKRAARQGAVIFSFAISMLLPGSSFAVDPPQEEQLKGTITMSGAWALYPMAVKWAEEFRKLHPGVHIDISAGGAGKGMMDTISGMVDIGKISRDIYPDEIERGIWWVAVAKDAVVPTVNSRNPAIKTLLKKGISSDTALGIWVREDIRDWSDISGVSAEARINVYTRSDACGAAETWSDFMGVKQDDLGGVGVYGDPGLAQAVRSDIYAIGFSNINYAYDIRTGEQLDGIAVLPIDTDGNGMIDPDEYFYENRDSLVSAIADGRYPSPPARELYFVCRGKPEPGIIMEFIKWVLTDGQKFTQETGYVGITQEKIRENLAKTGIN